MGEESGCHVKASATADLVARALPPDHDTLRVVIPGKPMPWQRAYPDPRTGRIFTPKETRAYQKRVREAAWAVLAQSRRLATWPLDLHYAMELVIVFPDRRTRDADNVEKTAKDAMQGVVFKNDKRVIRDAKRVEYDKANPRLEITVTVIREEP